MAAYVGADAYHLTARECDLDDGGCGLRFGVRDDPHRHERWSLPRAGKPLAPGIEAALGKPPPPADGANGLATRLPLSDDLPPELRPLLIPLASPSRHGSALQDHGAILPGMTRCGSPDAYGTVASPVATGWPVPLFWCPWAPCLPGEGWCGGPVPWPSGPYWASRAWSRPSGSANRWR